MTNCFTSPVTAQNVLIFKDKYQNYYVLGLNLNECGGYTAIHYLKPKRHFKIWIRECLSIFDFIGQKVIINSNKITAINSKNLICFISIIWRFFYFDDRKEDLGETASSGNYMFKVNNRNTRTRCEICSKLTIRIPQRRQLRRYLMMK